MALEVPAADVAALQDWPPITEKVGVGPALGAGHDPR